MKQGMTSRSDLQALVAAMRRSHRVYAPVEQSVGVVVSELADRTPLALEYSTLKKPAKSLFFPQSESILRYEGEAVQAAPPTDEKAVLFGSRPCDARALGHLDSIFAEGEFQDPYYLARRRNTIVVSLACDAPQETCFCVAMGGGPFDESGSDVLLFAHGESLLFRACSPAGEVFLGELANELSAPSRKVLTRLAEARKQAAAKGASGLPRLEDRTLYEALGAAADGELWDRHARRCLSCSACAFLCPTCHCFAFCDEPPGEPSGKSRGRYRTWDACSTPAFTLEASGHNPRAEKGARLRQRLMHKFRYAVENCGGVFCVGCGRCVGNCPVNIDIREIIAEIVGGKAS